MTLSFVGTFHLIQNQKKRFQQFVNPFTCQVNVTQFATQMAEFVKVRTQQLELKMLDLQNSKSYKDFLNTVDRNKFQFLKDHYAN